MRYAATLVLLLTFGCGKPNDLSSDDIDYIRTSVDLTHTRMLWTAGADSAVVLHALDSIYRLHHTSKSQFRAASGALADDPAHAQKVFEAIGDSLKKKR
jgi:hypothetical protein